MGSIVWWLTRIQGSEDITEYLRRSVRKCSLFFLLLTRLMELRCLRSIRERLKEVLRQYELRERHFECVVRSKELEVLLSRARAAEQKQLADSEKARADKLDEDVRGRTKSCCLSLTLTSYREQSKQLRKELDDAMEQQAVLNNKLVSFCTEVPAYSHRAPFSVLMPTYDFTAGQRTDATIPTTAI